MATKTIKKAVKEKTVGRLPSDVRKDIKDHIPVITNRWKRSSSWVDIVSAFNELKTFIDTMPERDAKRLGGRGRK